MNPKLQTQHSDTRNFYIFVISCSQSFISQILRVTGPLGEKFDFFNPLGSDIQWGSHYETSKIKFHLLRALKRYLKTKNRIPRRKIETIKKFSAHSFREHL